MQVVFYYAGTVPVLNLSQACVLYTTYYFRGTKKKEILFFNWFNYLLRAL